MLIRRHFITILVSALILLVTPFAAQAQSYSFSLDKEDIVVYLNEDNSISLDYTFVFTNDSGAHDIDFVDVGTPNDAFDITYITAEVNDVPVTVSAADYQGSGSGFAVVLGTEAIKPGETGTVHVSVGKITSVLDRDSQDPKYASFVFSPTWFGPDLVHGNTDFTVAFHLPPGVQAEEPRFHLPDAEWLGADEPATSLDDAGRIVYTWNSEAANGHTQYVFGASFPLDDVPTYATQLAQPTMPLATEPAEPIALPPSDNDDPSGRIIAGTIFALLIGAIFYLKYSERRQNRLAYLSPQISIEGYGIKRGLTAVEAAIVLEQPLDKVLTMILFGIIKKGVAKITGRAPLGLDIVKDLPSDLYAYEGSFLEAFRIEDVRDREEKLQKMFIDLIKTVSEKMRGFSKDETQLYYRGIVQRAWEQVQGANTPEVKSREFDRSLDWLMLNHRFSENVQELFKDPGMTTPQWWSAYDRSLELPEHRSPLVSDHTSDSKVDHSVFQPHSEPVSPAREGKPASSALPGAEYAASIVNSVQAFSSSVIRDTTRFTERVHEVTNLQPIFASWETRRREKSFAEDRSEAHKSDEGFFSLFGGSDTGARAGSSSSHHTRSSSSSHHSSCACACAGCACACAGGGR